MSSIRTILFDADGVIQHATEDLHTRLDGALSLGPEPLASFVRELFAAERPSLSGEGDLSQALAQVVDRWGLAAEVAQRVEAWWCSIDVDQALVALVRSLRRQGYRCGLATNQNRTRASYMARELGYAELFDRCFYSCELGYTKPDTRYFAAVTDALGVAPAQILFIDDGERNVEAARAAGLQAAHFVHPRTPDALAAMTALLGRFAVRAGE
jgi:putative hydrolase of the HAD superfamily